jgi:hypothetical protein
MKAGFSSILWCPALCLGALIVAAPTRTLQAADCAVRASVPWEKAGPGYSAEAIVYGPTCATAVVLSVVRRPGGLEMLYDKPDRHDTVATGNAPIAIDLRPVTDISALATATGPSAMTAALRPWLIEQLRHRDGPKEPTDTKWRARGSAGLAGDCSVRVVMPWKEAGPGYTVDLFSDGADCDNAVIAVVVRAPGGRPVYVHANLANIWQIYFQIDNKTDMAKTLADIVKSPRTTADLAEWPAGVTERSFKPNDFRTMPADEFDRTSWNALRAAKRPALVIPEGLESSLDIVLMPDGRVINAAIVSQHR